VYGSFLLFAKRAEQKYGVPARDPAELGRRGMVGGQEDMIEDTAITMAGARPGRRRLKKEHNMALSKDTIERLAEHLEACQLQVRDTPQDHRRAPGHGLG
jgi:hypothetical protein